MPSIWEIGMWVVVVMGAWLTISDIMENIRIRREFERAKAIGRIVYDFRPSKKLSKTKKS